MKVLVVGGGGREHTIVWKLAQSSKVQKIYCAPGNAGTSELAENIEIKAEDIPNLTDFAEGKKVDLTIVGPEAPLAEGIVDEFRKRNLRIFGPTKEAAELEASKVFAKRLMRKYEIPSGEGEIFNSSDKALRYVDKVGSPIVIKADGLAAGKGVTVCKTVEEAKEAINFTMVEKRFGDAGNRVIVEECLIGEEASYIAFTDGETVVPMVTSQDHKPVYDGDKGPNTGGMGAYSPAPVVTEEIDKQIVNEILVPTVKGMAKEGRKYKGGLYCGLMVTEDGPKVLEFNVRFGDPENQVILPRLKSDLVEIVDACIDENLSEINLDWSNEACVCVVVASGGYPGSYEKGKEIKGLDEISKMDGVVAFHAGTAKKNGKIVTNGGRVLGITALGSTIKGAIDRTYQAVGKIQFEGMHCRRDIGAKALVRKEVYR